MSRGWLFFFKCKIIQLKYKYSMLIVDQKSNKNWIRNCYIWKHGLISLKTLFTQQIFTTISFSMLLYPIAWFLISFFLLFLNLCSKEHNVDKDNHELKPPQRSGKHWHSISSDTLYPLPLVTNIIICDLSVCRACKWWVWAMAE